MSAVPRVIHIPPPSLSFLLSLEVPMTRASKPSLTLMARAACLALAAPALLAQALSLIHI